jgi:hypothetical protein
MPRNTGRHRSGHMLKSIHWESLDFDLQLENTLNKYSGTTQGIVRGYLSSLKAYCFQ